MRIKKIEDAISLFKESASIHGQASITGNSVVCNKHADRLNNIIALLSLKGQLGLLKECLNNNDVSIRMWSAFALLPVSPDLCKPVLEEVANGNYHCISFAAEITLNEWKKGSLKFPQLAEDGSGKVVFKKLADLSSLQRISQSTLEKVDDIQGIFIPSYNDIDIYHDYNCYCRDMKQYTIEQCYIFAIEWYKTEVCNGGHYQFLSNPTGIVWKEALDGLKAIGALQLADNLQHVCSKFHTNPPFDKKEREEELDALNDFFQREDDTFFLFLERLDVLIKNYINKHIDAFKLRSVN